MKPVIFLASRSLLLAIAFQVGMLTDIRINPDNKLVFHNFYAILPKKYIYINTSRLYPKY